MNSTTADQRENQSELARFASLAQNCSLTVSRAARIRPRFWKFDEQSERIVFAIRASLQLFAIIAIIHSLCPEGKSKFYLNEINGREI